MSQLYEGMFLLDNDVVRAGWNAAKHQVTDLVTKHGGKVVTARRWSERKLAYPVRGRRRGTFLLMYYELPRTGIPPFVRDLDLSESLLRYLLLRCDALPEGEAALAAQESAADYSAPVPPSDEAGIYAVVQNGIVEAPSDRAIEPEIIPELEGAGVHSSPAGRD
jgi:small subunit ribosomal protein S6